MTFSPSAGDLRQAVLLLSSDGAEDQPSVVLDGMGLPPRPAVTLVPGGLELSAIFGGSPSEAEDVTVSNPGTAALHVSNVALSGPNPGDFSFAQDCTASPVPVGGHCTISVTFAPLAVGERTAQIILTDDAPDSPQQLSLTGLAAPGFQLTTQAPAATTITSGGTAEYDLELVPDPEFSGVVQLACSGAPPEASCIVSPDQVQVENGGSVDFMVSVTTTGATGVAPTTGPRQLDLPPVFIPVLMTGLLLLAAVRLRPARARGVRIRLVEGTALLTLLVVLAVGGCSSVGSSGGTGSLPSSPSSPPPPASPPASGTQAGTSTLIVTATSGGITAQIELTLTVE